MVDPLPGQVIAYVSPDPDIAELIRHGIRTFVPRVVRAPYTVEAVVAAVLDFAELRQMHLSAVQVDGAIVFDWATLH